MKRAVVPGTYDPITNGHLDVIMRASKMADEVIVAVARSIKKNPLFSFEKRFELAKEACKDIKNVEVMAFDGLLVDFAHTVDADCFVKGLRAVTDFEYEFQMAALNYKLDKNLETMFVMSPPEFMYLSSSIVRELASMHADASELVPACVNKALVEAFGD